MRGPFVVCICCALLCVIGIYCIKEHSRNKNKKTKSTGINTLRWGRNKLKLIKCTDFFVCVLFLGLVRGEVRQKIAADTYSSQPGVCRVISCSHRWKPSVGNKQVRIYVEPSSQSGYLWRSMIPPTCQIQVTATVNVRKIEKTKRKDRYPTEIGMNSFNTIHSHHKPKF